MAEIAEELDWLIFAVPPQHYLLDYGKEQQMGCTLFLIWWTWYHSWITHLKIEGLVGNSVAHR